MEICCLSNSKKNMEINERIDSAGELKEGKQKHMSLMINGINKSTFFAQLANKTVTIDKSSIPTAANPSWFKDQTNWQRLGKSHC